MYIIDVHDDTLVPGQKDLDEALLTAIRKSDTMIVSCLGRNPKVHGGCLGRLASRRPSAQTESPV